MNQKKRRILCVEDHEDTCEVITYTLQDYEMISAATKPEAIEMTKVDEFCLYILDYHLPDGTGSSSANKYGASTREHRFYLLPGHLLSAKSPQDLSVSRDF